MKTPKKADMGIAVALMDRKKADDDADLTVDESVASEGEGFSAASRECYDALSVKDFSGFQTALKSAISIALNEAE